MYFHFCELLTHDHGTTMDNSFLPLHLLFVQKNLDDVVLVHLSEPKILSKVFYFFLFWNVMSM
jgi:hypothetical protein